MNEVAEAPFRASTGKPHAPELRAMNQIAGILDELSDPARVRVLSWVEARENEIVTQWDDKSPDEGQ